MNCRTTALACLLPCALSLAAGAALPPLAASSSEDVMLVRDPSFEDAKAKAWRFSDWPPRPKTRATPKPESIFFSTDIVQSGKQSICLDHTTVGPDRIFLAQQKLKAEALRPYDGRRLRMSAWVWGARGPRVYGGTLTIRLWGKRGAPPIGHKTLRVLCRRGHWTHSSQEFTLHMGKTQRADIGIGFKATPDQADSPVLYVDDIKLEVLADPEVSAELLSGRVVTTADKRVPLRVTIADKTWAKGLRHVRWDVTTADGRSSFGNGTTRVTAKLAVVEAELPELAPGSYAIRIALGSAPNRRDHETLLPFQLAAGPFAR